MRAGSLPFLPASLHFPYLPERPTLTDFQPDSPPSDLPEHWTDGAKDTFENVLDERPDLSGADFASLDQACALISSADLLEEAARDAGPLVKGSTGQLTVNPGLTEARLARTAAASILGRLGVPSKSGAKTNSQRGREAANARWGSK